MRVRRGDERIQGMGFLRILAQLEDWYGILNRQSTSISGILNQQSFLSGPKWLQLSLFVIGNPQYRGMRNAHLQFPPFVTMQKR